MMTENWLTPQLALALRRDTDFTCAELAHEMKLNRKTVQALEGGEAPALMTEMRYLAYFGEFVIKAISEEISNTQEEEDV